PARADRPGPADDPAPDHGEGGRLPEPGPGGPGPEGGHARDRRRRYPALQAADHPGPAERQDDLAVPRPDRLAPADRLALRLRRAALPPPEAARPGFPVFAWSPPRPAFPRAPPGFHRAHPRLPAPGAENPPHPPHPGSRELPAPQPHPGGRRHPGR